MYVGFSGALMVPLDSGKYLCKAQYSAGILLDVFKPPINSL